VARAALASTIIAVCVSAPLAAQAKQQGETEQAVPVVDTRDEAIVWLTARRDLWRHRATVRARTIYVLRARLRAARRSRGRRASALLHRSSTSTNTSGWVSATATWYGPGFYGHSPACGGPGLTESSWWVASMTLSCGTRVTICDGSRCARGVPVEDTGAFASGNFDVTPAVARALGGLYTHSVRWRLGS
jgi:hypothetical protein